MPDSKLSFLLRWTRPFLPAAARGVVDTRLEPARGSWARGRTMGPQHLHSIATFDQVLRHERARSLRSGQAFCLVRFTPQGNHTATPVVGALVNYLVDRLRAIDEMGWLDTRSIGVVLPYTVPEQGWNIIDDVCESWPDALPRPNGEVFRYPSSSPIHRIDRSGHGTPANRNGAEQNGNGASASGNGASASGNGASASGNGASASGNGASASGNGASKNGDSPVLNGEGLHGTGNRASGNGDSNGTNHYETNGDRHHGDQDRSTEGMEPFFVLEMPWWKRIIDIVGSVTGLILTSPLLLATALAIKMTSSGPVLFRQRRSGAGNKPFVILKFRTMRTGAEDEKATLQKFSEQDGPAFKLANDPRVTRLGRLLRQTSIDELPQLWNVLKGDMSLVGPRPLPCGESDASENWHRRRLDVAPGITGSWQVNGRSSIPFSEWARMDLHYVGSVSLVHDLKILVMTIPAVLSRRGAS